MPIGTAPFPRRLPGEAPQHEILVRSGFGGRLRDRRKGEGKRCGMIAIGLGLDLVQPPALQKRKRAGGAGRGRDRARCGGIGQRHGNLLERADLRAQMLNQDPTPCPACLSNASRRNEETFCTAWNVATHATDLNSRSCFVLNRVGARVKTARNNSARSRSLRLRGNQELRSFEMVKIQ